ncbi:PilZ domain-containing protein [Pseudoalteromonas byunsanensis]|uniref:PilZ domain-containing protein n=1 Tax=Pseudoalteromonas byunsanensis TaxID=327939 RepID=A0A1S1N675_9GAMM|nr:PilZ domain-containing protein [Pseudoalteromonas byunsanensis]OHU94149.1 PilZ domain-containing protein [Pseudoalteromonas byunsanensis]
MAEDKLQKYQPLIKELKSQLGNPDFDKLFEQMTKDISKPDRFLLKMEMSRLSQPIARFIDLRGQVAGDVKPYEHEGKQHFMDDLAIEVFEREIARHGGYTLAVYEEVMQTENNFRVMQKKAQDTESLVQDVVEQQPDHAKLVRFASYESRIEERMNYSIKISIELGKGNQATGTTSDISLSGAKIKLSAKERVNPGQLVSVRLTGLEQEFELGLKEGIQYEVIAVEPISSGFQHVRLKRTFIENSSSFDEFLNSFIHGNKRRYKVNLDNTMDAITCKGYEQYYQPRVNSLFVFFSQKEKLLLPTIALTNENNAFINYYFEDERKSSCLYQIFSQSRMATILALPNAVKESTVYSFTHIKDGKIYHYSAFDFELAKQPDLRNLFVAYGSQKSSWRTYKVQLMPSHHEDAFIPLSLPANASKNIEKLNKRPTPRVQSHIQDIKYLLLLTDISSQHQKEAYQKVPFDKNLVNKLKVFGRGKTLNPPKLDVVSLDYINLRAHKRYLYKTSVVLHIDGAQSCQGHTLDFSEMGLQVELAQPTELTKGSVIHLDLPDLQKITKQYTLSNLRYEVVAVSKAKTIINLKVSKLTDLPQVASEFFKLLINSNKDKLQPCKEAPRIPGLSTALRNMITKSVCQFPFYLHKETSHFKIGAVGIGLYPTPIHRLLMHYHNGKQGQLNMKPLFPAGFIESHLTEALRKHSRKSKPLKYTLFVAFDNKEKDINKALKGQCISQEESQEPLFLFQKKTITKNILFVFHLHVSKTGRPDTDYLANELRYVSHYALHKAKELEEGLWKVTGVCDLIDVTDEHLRTLDIDTKLITAMRLRKQTWLKALLN